MQESISGKTVLVRASLITVLAAIPFLPALSAGFPWDELLAMARASRFMLSEEHEYHRPLFSMIMWAERWLFGSRAIWYHVISLLIHTTNAVLVYHIARRMMQSEWAALVSGAIFAVFPTHAEALGLVMGQAQLLGGLFGFSSFLLYLAYAGNSQRPALVAGALFALVGMLAWQGVLFIPLLVVAHALLVRAERKALLEILLVYLLAVLVYMLAFRGVGEILTTGGAEGAQKGRILFSWGYYLYKLALPFNTSFLAPIPDTMVVVLALVASVSVAGLLWVEGLRKESVVLVAAIMLVLPAAVTSSVEHTTEAGFRHLYIPAAAVAVFWGLMLGRLGEGRRLALAAVPVVIVLGALAFMASMPWKSRADLWKQAAIDNPFAPAPILNLAAVHISEGRADEARDVLARGITYMYMDEDSLHTAMRLYADIGGPRDEDALLKAIVNKAGLYEGLYSIGLLHLNTYQSSRDNFVALGRAASYLELALAESPDSFKANYLLGVAYLEGRELVKSEAMLERASTLDRDGELKDSILELRGFINTLRIRGADKSFGIIGPGLVDIRNIPAASGSTNSPSPKAR